MLENSEHLRDSAGDLIEVGDIKRKARLGIFSAFGEPSDIVELMNDFRNYQKNILNK